MLHVTVIISFLTLAVTGMTLKFSYLPWAQWLAHALGGFQSAGTLHRMGALLTFFYFTRHIYDVHCRRKAAGKSLEGVHLRARRHDVQQARRRGVRPDRQVVPAQGRAAPVRPLDLLGEVRLLRRLLGRGHDRLQRADPVVPRVLHLRAARLVHQRGLDHPLGRGAAGDRASSSRSTSSTPTSGPTGSPWIRSSSPAG